jgi:hypothetical protein
MPLDYFSIMSQNVKNKHDIEGGIWLQGMCPHISKKGQSHSYNHLGQNSLIKTHTPYPKGH